MLIVKNSTLDLDYRRLPKQEWQMVQLTADRFWRADAAMAEWAAKAKECVEFVEGKQWSAADLARREAQKRPSITLNKTNNLVRLVLGYHRNNRTDVKYLPGFDNTGTQSAAEALTRLAKMESERNAEPFVDTEVMLDGLLTGRGYYDYRLSFEKNVLGELKIVAKDPFSIKIDPDATTYDPAGDWGYVIEDRWVSIDEVEFQYGKGAAAMLWQLLGAGRNNGYVNSAYAYPVEEIAPWRGFGGVVGENAGWETLQAYIATCYDPARKNIRLLDMQHVVRTVQWCFVDLETGDKEPVPDSWDAERVKKVLDYAKVKYYQKGQTSPLTVVKAPVKRVRWTTMAGDVMVYDNWSPYETYTILPFFPYFRRGKTRGMVEDLLDPGRERNTRRSAAIDIVTRVAHSGWIYHESSLDEEQEENLERNGARAGVNIKWKGDKPPEKIQASPPPMAMERLEQLADDDEKGISGINDSALGMLDRVQSGRALEARQRQAVLAIQIYIDNMTRTKELGGRKKLETFQNCYTEHRIFRMQGDSGADIVTEINKRDAAGQIVNDITQGKYRYVIDETPLAASFAQAQFDELMLMFEKGVLPPDIARDVAIDVSSLPQKEVLKARVQALMSAAGIPMGPNGMPTGPLPVVGPSGEQTPIAAASPDGAPMLSQPEGMPA